MSKKNILSIIVVLFLIIVSSIFYYFFMNKEQTDLAETELVNNNPFGDFFPVENVGAADNQNSGEVPTNPFEEGEPKLKMISDVPISGSVVFERKVGTSTIETVSRYVERATGHIYEMVQGEKSAKRISNTTIPKIYSAFFAGNNNFVIYRYLDAGENIDTYVAEIKENKTDTSSEEKTSLEGLFMKKNILDIVVSPDGKSLFNFIKNAEPKSSYKSLGSLSLVSNPNTEKLIFNSYTSEWTPEWINADIISFNNKASYISGGYLYLFNIKTKSFNKVLGPLNGLVSKVSPNATKVIYSLQNGGSPELRFSNVSKDDAFEIPNPTIADKCVWATDNKNVYCAIPNNIYETNLPDSWYTGEKSFNDSLVRIDTDAQETTTILNGSDYPTSFDMINIQVSPKQDVVYFTNKKDLKFWSLEIK